jgi:UDP-2-acetamido-3-amino-2,3-dideoxy-glucuronate N-acetyltransferase
MPFSGVQNHGANFPQPALVNIYDSVIGKNTMVAAFVEIGGSTVGDDCKIQAHSFLCPGTKIGNRVFIGPGVIFCNDKHPRATGGWTCEGATVEDGASIGAGAIILPGVTIGKGAMIGAGAVVTKDVGPGIQVVGVPGRQSRMGIDMGKEVTHQGDSGWTGV